MTRINNEYSSITTLNSLTIIKLFFISILLAATTIISWLYALTLISKNKNSIFYAIEQIGIMLISKYIPGKIWGILARSASASRYNLSPKKVLWLSISEQFISIYSAITLSVIILTLEKSRAISILLIIPNILLGFIIFKAVMHTLPYSKWIKKILKNKETSKENIKIISIKDFLYFFLLYTTQWLIIIAIFYTIAAELSLNSTKNEILTLSGAYILAVTGGFLAIFSPGGILVREGIFIGFSSIVIDTNTAIQIALIMRIWNMLYDIMFSTVSALVFFHKKQK